jgi:hypothetical protein
MSEDQLMQVLQYLAIVLFLSAGVLPLARGRQSWARRARWGAIAVFSIAVLFALFLTLRWALDRGY